MVKHNRAVKWFKLATQGLCYLSVVWLRGAGHGQLDNAMASFRRALEIKPDFAEVHNSLLFTLNYTARHTPLYCLEQAHQYGRIVAAKVGTRFSDWQCSAQPERLRVGLVSGDFLSHPVKFFLEGLLVHIDPARIELIAYPTHYSEDELTARIRPYFSAWKPLVGKSDEAAARLIHADGVHVLLDLSGHTAHNSFSRVDDGESNLTTHSAPPPMR